MERIPMTATTDYEKIEKHSQNRKRAAGIVTYTLLILWALMVLFPFYWMILTSVKSYSAYKFRIYP